MVQYTNNIGNNEMNKFFEYFGRYRKPIGYTIGSLNLLSGISYISAGYIAQGITWVILGLAILIDAKMFK